MLQLLQRLRHSYPLRMLRRDLIDLYNYMKGGHSEVGVGLLAF